MTNLDLYLEIFFLRKSTDWPLKESTDDSKTYWFNFPFISYYLCFNFFKYIYHFHKFLDVAQMVVACCGYCCLLGILGVL